jgi:hypothetical protein
MDCFDSDMAVVEAGRVCFDRLLTRDRVDGRRYDDERGRIERQGLG